MLGYLLRPRSLVIPEFENYSGGASTGAAGLMGFGNELLALHHWTQVAGYAGEQFLGGPIDRVDNHSRLSCLVTTV